MRKTICLLFAAVVLNWAEAEEEETLSVAVSVLPHAGLVERIGGGRAEVTVLVSKGADPHAFVPTARKITRVSQCDIWFVSGMPFEESLRDKLAKTAKDLHIVPAFGSGEEHEHGEHNHEDEGHEEGEHEDEDHGEGEHEDEDHGEGEHEDEDHGEGEHEDEGHEEGEHEDEDHGEGEHEDEGDHHDHDHGDLDPHLWLSVPSLKGQVHLVAEELAYADPDGARYYKQNAAALEEELATLQAELSEQLAPFKGTVFYVFHPAFGHFAEAYGLTQEAIESGGREPSPKHLSRLIKEAKQESVKLILVQPQFSQASARKIARAIDAEVVEIDPLAKDVFATLRALAGAVQDSR